MTMLPPPRHFIRQFKAGIPIDPVCHLKGRKRNRLPHKVFQVNSQHGVKQQKCVVPKPELVTEILKPVFAAVPSKTEVNLNCQS